MLWARTMNKSRLQAAAELLSISILAFLFSTVPACERIDESDVMLKVVATTSIVGDVVSAVGGDRIEIFVLMPRGSDPHSLEPTPRDLAAVAEADLIFANGLGLESFLERLVANARGNSRVVEVSDGIEARHLSEAGMHGHDHGDFDPHVWMDPNSVVVWTRNIRDALSTADTENANFYGARAKEYGEKLDGLDGWIKEAVSAIPMERRKLVTDHLVLGYFADRYGFTQLGSVLTSFSVLASPSARELAQIEKLIFERDVPAIFVSTTANQDLARQVAADTGCRIVPLYTGSLSDADGPAADYISFIRYNVESIVSALK